MTLRLIRTMPFSISCALAENLQGELEYAKKPNENNVAPETLDASNHYPESTKNIFFVSALLCTESMIFATPSPYNYSTGNLNTHDLWLVKALN